MNILFLGSCTDEKRFFLLSLAKVMTLHQKVVIYSTEPYGYDSEEVYDFCGIEIHHIKAQDSFITTSDDNTINFIDTDKYIPLEKVDRVVAVSEPFRKNLTESVELAGKYLNGQSGPEFMLVHLNILEYCKANEKYLALYWRKNLNANVEFSHEYVVFFEEVNRIIMIESQFAENFRLKDLTSSYKNLLMKLTADILNLGGKDIRKMFRKAERMN